MDRAFAIDEKGIRFLEGVLVDSFFLVIMDPDDDKPRHLRDSGPQRPHDRLAPGMAGGFGAVCKEEFHFWFRTRGGSRLVDLCDQAQRQTAFVR